MCVRECTRNALRSHDGIGIASEELVKLLSQSAAPCLAADTPRAARFASGALNTAAYSVRQRRVRWRFVTRARLVGEAWPRVRELVGETIGALRSTATVTAGAPQKTGLITGSRSSPAIGADNSRAIATERSWNHIKRWADMTRAIGRSRRRTLVLSSGNFAFGVVGLG